jgi:hypothetical protein
MSVVDACEHGTRADLLAALRWRAEQAFFDPTTKASALVSLSKFIVDILREQGQLEAQLAPRRRLMVADEPWTGDL